MRVGGSAQGVDRHLDAATGAILESHRHRQAGGELAVHLALGRARPDRAPRHDIGDELRQDRIEELTPRRHTQLCQRQQQLTGGVQPIVDGEAAIHVRIVDQALPADRGAGLLEVDAHHDDEVVSQAVGLGAKASPVFLGRRRIVGGAGPDHHHQSVVPEIQHVADLVAGRPHEIRPLLRERLLLEQDRGRNQRLQALDAQIAGAAGDRAGIVHHGVHAGHLDQAGEHPIGHVPDDAHRDAIAAREEVGVESGGGCHRANRVMRRRIAPGLHQDQFDHHDGFTPGRMLRPAPNRSMNGQASDFQYRLHHDDGSTRHRTRKSHALLPH